MALIDHERLAEPLGVDLVGRHQIDRLDLALLAARQNARDIAAAVARHQAEVEPAHARRRGVQDGKSVPVVANDREAAGQGQDRRAVFAGERPHADDDQRVLRSLELLGKADFTLGELAQGRRPRTQPFDRIG